VAKVELSMPQTARTSLSFNGRWRRPWLALARAGWIATAMMSVAILTGSVVVRLLAFDTLAPSSLPAGWTLEDLHTALIQLGLSMGFFIAYNLFAAYTIWLSFITIAAIIFWRRSDDRMALLVAFMLLTWPVSEADFGLLLATAPIWQTPIAIVGTLGTVVFQLFFFLFPDARFAPRWTAVIFLVWAPLVVLAAFFPGSIFDRNIWPSWLALLAQVSLIVTSIMAQIYRYTRVSGPLERQQTKWVVFALTGLALTFLGYRLSGQIFPVLASPGIPGLLYLMATPLLLMTFLAIPISLGVAMMRYHLWDIDILIRRTLIYGALTAALSLVYFGSVVLLEQFLRNFSDQDSQLAIVASTLAIAALFNPLHHRVQDIIDRRFYRRKYDAEQTLAAFSTVVREEVALDSLIGQLIAVIEETIKPMQVTLWLQNPDRRIPGADDRKALS
jgi:hypothetical protein